MPWLWSLNLDLMHLLLLSQDGRRPLPGRRSAEARLPLRGPRDGQDAGRTWRRHRLQVTVVTIALFISMLAPFIITSQCLNC